MDISIVETFVVALFTTALGIIGYLLKDIRTTLKKELEDHDEDIDAIKEDLAKFKASLPRNFVMRDDFLRAISTLDHKMDSLSNNVNEISKSLSELIGGGKNNEKNQRD